jgi:hypothetical protein
MLLKMKSARSNMKSKELEILESKIHLLGLASCFTLLVWALDAALV